MEIKVLDKGFVRLVSSMGDDASVARSARVSYGPGTKTKRQDAGLINYLVKNKHTSPLESVVFTFHLKMPIFVARQWHRHRTWAYNEISARYSEMKDEFYIPEFSRIKGQDSKNRQASGEELHPDVQAYAVKTISYSYSDAYDRYLSLINQGVARELARMVLPVGLYTEFYGTVNLKNLLDFIALRDDAHAQEEIQVYAQAMKEIIKNFVPITVEAFDNARSGQPTNSD